MKTYDTVDKLAYEGVKHVPRVWKVLVQCASSMKTINYGAICKELGINGRGMAITHALGTIEGICQVRGLPLLNYIAVNKATQRPGSHVSDLVTERAWRAQVLAVYAFDWSLVVFEEGIK